MKLFFFIIIIILQVMSTTGCKGGWGLEWGLEWEFLKVLFYRVMLKYTFIFGLVPFFLLERMSSQDYQMGFAVLFFLFYFYFFNRIAIIMDANGNPSHSCQRKGCSRLVGGGL
jgi:hypothetical protein